LDWEDPLPADDLDRAYKECQKSGALVLCLGTSLRIQPIGDLPLEAEKFVIVNLQKTPHDERATLIIRGPVDEVMNELVVLLGYPSWQKDPEAPIERVWAPPRLPAPLGGASVQNGLQNMGILNNNTELLSGGKKKEDAIEIDESDDAEDERKETPNSSTGLDRRKSRARPNFRNFTPSV